MLRSTASSAALDAVRADFVFGWRQLRKNRASSMAAILSLALAIGACACAFRLIDALLLRPLPVANAGRLYSISNSGLGPGGDFRISDSSEYPLFRLMREAVKDSAELIAVSFAERVDLTFGSSDEMEKANLQYVSGWMFREFGIQPALGRLLTEGDDMVPGAHPHAVISHNYWTRRFARDPNVVGCPVRIGNALYEIAGVAAAPFTGTETGIAVDFFVPSMMNPSVTRSDASWFRPLAVLKDGVAPQAVQSKLQAVSRAFQEDRAKGFTNQSRQYIERFLNQTLLLEPAASGASGLQRDYRRPLLALAVFAALVLLIACANVANLMTVQTAARAKEMALRVSIGASRLRLIQLVLAESLWLGAIAAILGGAFAWWATPFLVERINPPDNPAYLLLPAEWRVLTFGAILAIGVTCLFGCMPALRASSARPLGALKGGGNPHSRGRLMYALIALQAALCLIVLFAASLLTGTLERLSTLPLGFSSDGLLAVETKSARPQPPEVWDQAAAQVRLLPGVESVALASWPLLSGTGANGIIWVNGESTEVLSYFLAVSPEWRSTMGIALLDGRDFRSGESSPGLALVNEAFVKQCLGGGPAIGQRFERGNHGPAFQVIGVVRDARYRNLREPITPTAYIPMRALNKNGETLPIGSASLLVRASAGAGPILSLPATLRKEVPRARPELRVSSVRTQIELNRRHTVRERLIASLAAFFAVTAWILAGVGLYGVLGHSVLQRRREIGIRMAIGAQPRHVVWRVLGAALCTVFVGGCAGGLLSLTIGNFAGNLLYGVQAADANRLVIPALAILAAALLASVPAILRVVRIDPVSILRSE